MSEKYKVKENYNCIYTEKRNCIALLTLHKEFHEYIHMTLIYKELLPSYCAKCPVLKMIADALIEEGAEWIESSAKRE